MVIIEIFICVNQKYDTFPFILACGDKGADIPPELSSWAHIQFFESMYRFLLGINCGKVAERCSARVVRGYDTYTFTSVALELEPAPTSKLSIVHACCPYHVRNEVICEYCSASILEFFNFLMIVVSGTHSHI